MEEVHNRGMEERDPIVFNDRLQPVGPNKDVVKTFRNFLGTVAENASLVPINFIS